MVSAVRVSDRVRVRLVITARRLIKWRYPSTVVSALSGLSAFQY